MLQIITDWQQVDLSSCYGSGFTQTPRLYSLGSEAVWFDRAWSGNIFRFLDMMKKPVNGDAAPQTWEARHTSILLAAIHSFEQTVIGS